jgi:hypothetical protein
MEPGVGDCVVWWDAWGFFVSLAALVAAGLTVVVTAVSAIAVFSLGSRANELALAAQRIAREQREERRDKEAAERETEEVVMLYYLASEIASLHTQLAWLDAETRPGGRFAKENIWTLSKLRDELADSPQLKLETDRIVSLLPRLHAVRPAVGLRCARLAGDCAEIQIVGGDLRDKLGPSSAQLLATTGVGADFSYSFDSFRIYIERALSAADYLATLVYEKRGEIPAH